MHTAVESDPIMIFFFINLDFLFIYFFATTVLSITGITVNRYGPMFTTNMLLNNRKCQNGSVVTVETVSMSAFQAEGKKVKEGFD